MGHVHQVPKTKTKLFSYTKNDKNIDLILCLILTIQYILENGLGTIVILIFLSRTHRDQELLDLLHSMCHAKICFWDGCCYFNEHMQLHGQVSIFSLTTFPQLFLLKMYNR